MRASRSACSAGSGPRAGFVDDGSDIKCEAIMGQNSVWVNELGLIAKFKSAKSKVKSKSKVVQGCDAAHRMCPQHQ